MYIAASKPREIGLFAVWRLSRHIFLIPGDCGALDCRVLFLRSPTHVQARHGCDPAATGHLSAVSRGSLAAGVGVADRLAAQSLDSLPGLGADRRGRVADALGRLADALAQDQDRKSTRLNSSH